MPERVDEWDDEVAPVRKPVAPARAVPAAPTEAASTDVPAPAPGEVPAEGEDDADRHIPWRQAIRGAPTWVWLIAIFSIGSICMMVGTVVMIIAIFK